MQKPVFPLALLAALLFASSTHAQQTTTKVKTKSAKPATIATPPTDLLPAPPAGPGPQGPSAMGGPAGPRPPHGPQGKGEHGPDPRDERGPKGGLQVLTDVRGTLTAYQANNDEQVYDAFVLRAEGGTIDTVRFPRHLGQQLTAAAKAGSTVMVTGVRDQGPDGRRHFRFVSLTSGSQTVRDTRPTPPATPPTEQTTAVSGTIRELRRDPRGHVRGILLSDQTVVQLSPQALEQLADKLKPGAAVEVSGVLRGTRPGEALATSTPPRVVRAETLTLDKVKYLVH